MEITSEIKNHSKIIHLVGNLDVHNTHKIESAFIEQIKTGNSRVIVLDLSSVEFISSAGLRIIVAALRICREKDVEFRLAGIKPAVRKVFEIIDMNSMFSIFETLESAIK
ncbi:STAS domain-containing protein [Leptospira noguchii]|uniref:Anti-sigma factor antagonist n=1 Tax=Leptospira noguchii serovar Autumnalis str. ZUN142 TaxID=1085540 RepID=M6UPK0_9LEPT|nr:STAS domain-containing protein [Leptospira noguchii]EMO42974.1 STAS domain protein [Leptospira noguchii serovar Autumnalis str. ZUN142]UOG47425.1 STAS domain-containing protein [Leptospira noguchii]